MKKLLSITALGSLLAALVLAAAPAWAENVDSRIQALENELTRLKGEQMELKREAVAAAAAMPTFNYRPGRGLTLEAADKSWAFRVRYEFNIDLNWQEGNDGRRNGDFEIFGRRNRPFFHYISNGGLYEYEMAFDCDANEKCGGIHAAVFYVHFENMSPWFPKFQIGIHEPAAINTYDQGSTRTAATLEYPLVRRGNGFNTGIHTGTGLVWEDLPAPGGLFPGTWNAHYYWVINGMSRGNGDTDQSSKTDHVVYFNVNPFSRSKNKWLNGIGASVGAWFGNVDERNTTNTRRRLQLRTATGSTKVSLFDTGTDADRGLHAYITPGLKYRVGPYTLLASGGFDRWNSSQRSGADKKAGRGGEVGRVEGTYWKLINEIFVWSPKGLFTGTTSTPKSLLMAWSFERDDAICGRPNCNEDSGSSGQFSSNRVLLRELDLRYFVQSNVSVLLGWQWYDAANLGTQQQVEVGCSKNNNTRAGRSCDWHDVTLRVAYYF